jgi:hypothetical protein
MQDEKKEETTAGQQQGEATNEGKQPDLDPNNIRPGRASIPPAMVEED